MRVGLGPFQRMLNWSNRYHGKFVLFLIFFIPRFLKLPDSHPRCVGISMAFRNAARLKSTLKFLMTLNGCQTTPNSPVFAHGMNVSPISIGIREAKPPRFLSVRKPAGSLSRLRTTARVCQE